MACLCGEDDREKREKMNENGFTSKFVVLLKEKIKTKKREKMQNKKCTC